MPAAGDRWARAVFSRVDAPPECSPAEFSRVNAPPERWPAELPPVDAPVDCSAAEWLAAAEYYSWRPAVEWLAAAEYYPYWPAEWFYEPVRASCLCPLGPAD